MYLNYLKVKEYNGYDDFYLELIPDKTWSKTLNLIESILDDKYCNNENSIVGIKLNIEIVSLSPTELSDLGIEENDC